MVEAMQEMRKNPGREHPYYWAPFLVIGQDGPLRDGTAQPAKL
jgi:CHAT domain-containing protein